MCADRMREIGSSALFQIDRDIWMTAVICEGRDHTLEPFAERIA
jgi:hypothetical protein